jgi:hypothetical protein
MIHCKNRTLSESTYYWSGVSDAILGRRNYGVEVFMETSDILIFLA